MSSRRPDASKGCKIGDETYARPEPCGRKRYGTAPHGQNINKKRGGAPAPSAAASSLDRRAEKPAAPASDAKNALRLTRYLTTT
jgi:hypothetical protein